jgi:small subunit ribosomal protein S19e
MQRQLSKQHGATVKDVSPSEFISAYAAFLKKSGKLEVPKWADLVKTGTFQELAPTNRDWFYVRTAAIARRLYLRGGVGVGALKRGFGGSKRNGSRPAHHASGSGAIARAALKQLQKLKLIELDRNGGRKITSVGKRDLDRIAQRVLNRSHRKSH